jgi:8-oxo-dGTP diphosphatase
MDSTLQPAAFRFCPWCGGDFTTASRDGRERLVCTSCDRVFYVNPAPASAVAITDDGRIVLVKRKFEPYEGMWCLPAGFIEVDEHPEETAVREVFEETGLEIKITDLYAIYSGNDDPRTTVILVVYRADYVSGELRPGDDASEAQWFDLDSTPEDIAFSTHRRVIENLKRER